MKDLLYALWAWGLICFNECVKVLGVNTGVCTLLYVTYHCTLQLCKELLSLRVPWPHCVCLFQIHVLD